MSATTTAPELEEAPLVDGSPFRTIRILVPLLQPGRHPTRQTLTVVLDFTGRTAPKRYRLLEEGRTFECETWQRLDEELDYYEDMLAEAKANGRNPQLEASHAL